MQGLFFDRGFTSLVEIHQRQRNDLPAGSVHAVVAHTVAFNFVLLHELVGAILEVKLSKLLASERQDQNRRQQGGEEASAFESGRIHSLSFELDAHFPTAGVSIPDPPVPSKILRPGIPSQFNLTYDAGDGL